MSKHDTKTGAKVYATTRRHLLKAGGVLIPAAAFAPGIFLRKARAAVAPTSFDYYISPTGSDSNPGTLAQPWAITAINTKHSTYAGKTLGLLPGTYRVSSLMGTNENVAALTIAGGSGPSNQTYIASANSSGGYSRGSATLQANDNGLYGGGNANESPIMAARAGADYWTVDGLRFTGFSMWAFHVGNSPSGGACITGWTIQNCEFTGGNDQSNTASNGVNCGVIIVYASINGTVTNNWFHDNVGSTDTQHWSCVYQWGLGDTPTSGNVYTYNTIVKSGNLHGKEAPQYGTEIAYNYIDMTGTLATSEYCGAAIMGFMADGGNAGGAVTSWHHNVIRANGMALDFNNDNPSHSYTDSPLRIYNNTVVVIGQQTSGYVNGGYDGSGTGRQVSAYNNLYYDNGQSDGTYGYWLTNTNALALCDYNIYGSWNKFCTVAPGATTSAGMTSYGSLSAWAAAIGGQEAHSMTSSSSPFTSTGVDALQFQISSGSPAYQAGRVGGVSTGAICHIGAWDGTVTRIGCSFANGAVSVIPDPPSLSVS